MSATTAGDDSDSVRNDVSSGAVSGGNSDAGAEEAVQQLSGIRQEGFQ